MSTQTDGKSKYSILKDKTLLGLMTKIALAQDKKVEFIGEITKPRKSKFFYQVIKSKCS